MAEAATRVRRAEAALAQELGRRPSLSEVAAATGVDEDTVAQLRRAALAPASLSEPAADGEPALEELLGDGGAGDPAAAVCERGEADCLRAALTALDERSRRVLELRYGIGGRRSHSLADVAGELGVSSSRVRKLEARSLRALSARPELRELRAAA